MQGKMKFTYLGMDSFKGKKDPEKMFYQVSLLQENEVIKVFLGTGQEVLFDGLEKFDEVLADMSWKLGQDKYGMKIDYRIVTLEPLPLEIPSGTDASNIEDINKNRHTA